MTVTLTYVPATLDAVVASLTSAGLPTTAVQGQATGRLQRSTDQINWSDVRGGRDVTLTAGTGVTPTAVNDFEFIPGTVNYYRWGLEQQVVDAFGRTVASGGWGTADSGQVWTGTSSILSVGSSSGLMTLSSANTSATVVLATPQPQSDAVMRAKVSPNAVTTVAACNSGFFVRRIDGSNFYRVKITWDLLGLATLILEKVVAGVTTQLASVNLADAYTGSNAFYLKVEAVGSTLRARAWLTTNTEPTTWSISTTDTTFTGGIWGCYGNRLTGNTNAGMVLTFDDLTLDTGTSTFGLSTTTGNITPTTDSTWLKSTARAFLNMPVMVVDFSPTDRDPRGGLNYAAGRTLGSAQVEVSTGRAFTLTIRTSTLAIARQLEYLIASGDVIFLQPTTPDTTRCPFPAGYYRVESTAGYDKITARGNARLYSLPLREVAAPGPDIVTARATWASVIAQYGTWENLVAQQPTWEALLASIVGQPSEVIVP